MSKIEVFKEKIPTGCDISITAIYSAIELYKKKFYTYPKLGLKIKVGINDVCRISYLLRNRIDEQIKKELGIEIWFECDKSFNDYYWEVVGVEDGKKFIVYSEGA